MSDIIDQLAKKLEGITGRIVVSDLRKLCNRDTKIARSVERFKLAETMARLGWDGRVVYRLNQNERVRRCYVKGTSRRIVYIHRDPITNSLYVGYTKPADKIVIPR